MSTTSKVVKSRKPPNAGKGRVKGVPNKSTKAVKEALEIAFEGMGGAERLTTWAKSNETEFYKLWVKMLPTDVKADVNLHVTKIVSEIVRASDTNR